MAVALVNSSQALELVLTVGAGHGITQAGVCSLGDISGFIECRGRSRLPTQGSVIVLLLPYYTGQYPSRNVALYAIPDDYHRIAGSILEEMVGVLRRAYPTATLLPFVDSSPIPEVEAAWLAGLGFCGRNHQLITPRYGSMAFICEIVTDMLLTPSVPATGSCGSCMRCVQACPTGALDENGFDKQRCRSEITQKKGELSDWEQQQVTSGGLAWGCDICTEACPHNVRLDKTPVPQLGENLRPLLSLERLDTEITAKSYVWRGKAVLRRNLELIAQRDERK